MTLFYIKQLMTLHSHGNPATYCLNRERFFYTVKIEKYIGGQYLSFAKYISPYIINFN